MISNPPKRLKVVRIIARLNIGGPARQVCLLHERLHDEFETVLITGQLDQGEGDMSSLLASERGVHHIGSMSRPIRLWSDVTALLQMLRILRNERPDIVHTHTAKAGALGRVAAVLAGVPIRVHTYHGHVFHGYFSPFVTRLFIWIERSLNRFTSAVIAISPSQRAELVQTYGVVAPDKTHVVPTGFDFSSLPEKFPQTVTTVGWAGRLTGIKGIDLLAEVISRTAVELPRLKFMIAGDGPERAKLERLPTNNFKLLGWQRDMAAFWNDCDVALLTSLNEGTPASLIEAMATGKPFVATDVGGILDIAGITGPLASHGAHGFLCQDVNCILAALKRLADDPALARTMGESASAFARSHHSVDALEKNIRGLYRRLAAEKGLA